ncbi:MAG: CYTH domain-containing protein [Muribaculaceae bacterium]
MAKEIERKYLVTSTDYRDMASRVRHITQAYLSTDPRSTVRLRIIDGRGKLTVKGITRGATRDEWEFDIPADDACDMIEACACSKIIDKDRYIVDYEGHRWEVDEFHGEHEGLVVAEIELGDEAERFEKPGFIGREVTGDTRYYNSSLAGIC